MLNSHQKFFFSFLIWKYSFTALFFYTKVIEVNFNKAFSYKYLLKLRVFKEHPSSFQGDDIKYTDNWSFDRYQTKIFKFFFLHKINKI